MSLNRRLLTAGLVFSAIVALGSAGYMLIEGRPLLDPIYMAIITVTTVGYGEVYTLSPAGRLLISPDPSTRLVAGDVLVALGTREQLHSLAQLVCAPDPA